MSRSDMEKFTGSRALQTSQLSLQQDMSSTSSNSKETTNHGRGKESFIINKAESRTKSILKTVVLIFSFYGATEKTMDNYCKLYHTYGFDVVVVPSYLKHFAWPDISRELAVDLLDFLKTRCSDYEHILIHAFSMGAYNFTVCISTMYNTPGQYSDVQEKIKAIVYDSLTIGTLKNMARGVGLGISKNVVVQKMIPFSMALYFKLTSKLTVQEYENYIDLFKQKPLQVPTLLFYCKNDPMSEFRAVRELLENWKERFNHDIMDKWWEKSKHCAHLLKHREEYMQTVDTFLKTVPKLLKIDSKI